MLGFVNLVYIICRISRPLVPPRVHQCRPPRQLQPPRYRYQCIAYRMNPSTVSPPANETYPSLVALLTDCPKHMRHGSHQPETNAPKPALDSPKQIAGVLLPILVLLHHVSFLRSGPEGSINVSRPCKSAVVQQCFADSQARQAGTNPFIFGVAFIGPKRTIALLRILSSRLLVPLLAPAAPPLARYC